MCTFHLNVQCHLGTQHSGTLPVGNELVLQHFLSMFESSRNMNGCMVQGDELLIYRRIHLLMGNAQACRWLVPFIKSCSQKSSKSLDGISLSSVIGRFRGSAKASNRCAIPCFGSLLANYYCNSASLQLAGLLAMTTAFHSQH